MKRKEGNIPESGGGGGAVVAAIMEAARRLNSEQRGACGGVGSDGDVDAAVHALEDQDRLPPPPPPWCCQGIGRKRREKRTRAFVALDLRENREASQGGRGGCEKM